MARSACSCCSWSSVVGGLYLASLMAESLVPATYTLPSDIERLAGQVSGRITDLIRDQPYLRAVLPEPGTIDRLGDTNRALLIEKLSYGLTDFTTWVAQGFVDPGAGDLPADRERDAVGQADPFLRPQRHRGPGRRRGPVADHPQDPRVPDRPDADQRRAGRRGRGWPSGLLKVRFAFTLGIVAAVTNFVPYLGQLIGGALPTLDRPGTDRLDRLALVVAAIYLAVVGIEGYVVTPLVMGRSLDLNGTTVLLACLFWGYLWGLVGLVLAMPITVSVKVVLQTIPELNRWAELMSVDWQSPGPAIGPAPVAEKPAPRSP